MVHMTTILLVMVLVFQGNANLSVNIQSDRTLIVPGLGAEKILLGEDAQRILAVMGYPERIARFKKTQELFKHILNIKTSPNIYFTKIYYYKSSGIILFLNKKKVTSIVGLNNFRITSESVNLQNGAEYFIFNYGNKNLTTIRKKKNILYLYPQQGIAIVDDKNDDTINMYIIFNQEIK